MSIMPDRTRHLVLCIFGEAFFVRSSTHGDGSTSVSSFMDERLVFEWS